MESRVSLVHDTNRARSFADAHYIPHFYVNLADLLENPAIHCVYISGHPRHRVAATLAALSAGKHVLCETPLALSTDDGLTMTHTASRHGLVLAVNHHLRADPALHKMRQLLAEGLIGGILGGRIHNTALLHPKQQTWRLQPNGGGIVLDRTIHDIDLAPLPAAR